MSFFNGLVEPAEIALDDFVIVLLHGRVIHGPLGDVLGLMDALLIIAMAGLVLRSVGFVTEPLGDQLIAAFVAAQIDIFGMIGGQGR